MAGIDRGRIEAAVLEILAAIGEDPGRDGLEKTPSRVADAYSEFFAGVGEDAGAHLQRTIPVGDGTSGDGDAGDGAAGSQGERTSEAVLMRDITFRSVCEHHLLPFIGTAHIAYLPAEKVIGLGALPRVVETLAARPQVQERLTEQIADAINDGLEPRGVLVVLDAVHGCVTTRGPRQTSSSTVTVASRGALREPIARAEIFAMLGATTDPRPAEHPEPGR
ncbi:GTP cyclohydrolase I [Plantibacter sp. Mn2098]|uniref:GTP cyclohydrolase I n=1 Tax=Plantibacter sp. Mn2098 TaxID=3395266 RepID=UPI003BE6FFD5